MIADVNQILKRVKIFFSIVCFAVCFFNAGEKIVQIAARSLETFISAVDQRSPKL